ncbi:MAG: hypothetical protein A4S09_04970 [Proteobacteria bacterium SG_bin7]|nr:MAG: hypothetical protein A4S09_04970 [Proteobacteria bacterium SG_bin7]
MSEAKKKMTEEEILKSLDAIIDETIGSEETAQEQKEEQVAKSEESKNEKKDANGGDDKIKSGSPMSEKQEAAAKAKAKKSEDEDEDDKDEKAEKSESKQADLVKAEDKEEKKEMKQVAKEEVKAHEGKMHKKMKKSIEELSSVLDEEELELIKAWREENDEEESEETPADIAKSVAQAVGAQINDLKKAFDEKLSEKDVMIKSLSDEVKKLSSQPAHGRQSIDSLEALEKGGSSETNLTKAQVLDTMLDLQKAGKGITSHHIAEFEATRNLSNPVVRNLVMEATKKRFSN